MGTEGAAPEVAVDVGVEVAGVVGADVGDSDGVDDPPPPPLVAVPLRVNALDAVAPPGKAMVRVAPDSEPAAVGVHDRFTVQVPAAAIPDEVEQVPPATLTPLPTVVIPVGVVDDPPLFVTVTESDAAVPTSGLPNDPDENVSGPAGGATTLWIKREDPKGSSRHAMTERAPSELEATAAPSLLAPLRVTGVDHVAPPSELDDVKMNALDGP